MPEETRMERIKRLGVLLEELRNPTGERFSFTGRLRIGTPIIEQRKDLLFLKGAIDIIPVRPTEGLATGYNVGVQKNYGVSFNCDNRGWQLNYDSVSNIPLVEGPVTLMERFNGLHALFDIPDEYLI